MRRFLVLLLAFTSIFIFGCSNTGTAVSDVAAIKPSASDIKPIDLNNPNTLVGTYDITFFWKDTYISVLTNDCKKSKELGYKSEREYSGVVCKDTDDVELTGEGTITKDNNGNYQIITKVQMAGGFFDNPNSNPACSMFNRNKYNYTIYTPIPESEINGENKKINKNGKIKGTKGRNLTEKIELNDPHDQDEYVFTLLDDGSLLNEMIIKSKEETHKESRVIMILKKKNDAVITLEENKPYQKPAITDFQAEPVAQ